MIERLHLWYCYGWFVLLPWILKKTVFCPFAKIHWAPWKSIWSFAHPNQSCLRRNIYVTWPFHVNFATFLSLWLEGIFFTYLLLLHWSIYDMSNSLLKTTCFNWKHASQTPAALDAFLFELFYLLWFISVRGFSRMNIFWIIKSSRTRCGATVELDRG